MAQKLSAKSSRQAADADFRQRVAKNFSHPRATQKVAHDRNEREFPLMLL